MSGKIHLHLLFFCGILCQGISATVSDKDTRLSSDFLVRNRRVINLMPWGRELTRIENVNYLVRIKENRRSICAGAILSHYTVITAAPCVRHNVTNYHIQSGAAGDIRYNLHSVTWKDLYFGSLPHKPYDGIALITVDPPFVFNAKTASIPLHLEPLPASTMVSVSGWGYQYALLPGTELRQRLRTINLPIMNHEECHNDYQGYFDITDKHICTFCSAQYCARNDEGAPLVFNHKLVGIHTYKGENLGHRNPDVFINIARADYHEWIRQNAILM